MVRGAYVTSRFARNDGLHHSIARGMIHEVENDVIMHKTNSGRYTTPLYASRFHIYAARLGALPSS